MGVPAPDGSTESTVHEVQKPSESAPPAHVTGPAEVEQARRLSDQTTLRETVDDLARSADRQASRAAVLSLLPLSSRLFHLADELRSASVALGATKSREDVLELVDGAQLVVVAAMLQLDAAERLAGS